MIIKEKKKEAVKVEEAIDGRWIDVKQEEEQAEQEEEEEEEEK